MSEAVEQTSVAVGANTLGLGADIAERFGRAAAEWSDLAGGLAAAWSDADLLRDATLLMILAMTAAGCEILYWCYALPALRSLEAAPPASAARRVGLGAQRLALTVAGIVVSVGSVYGATHLLAFPETVRRLALLLVVALASGRAVVALSVFVLSPRRPQLRLWPASDATMRRAHRRVLVLAGLAAAGFAGGTGLDEVFGAPALGEAVENVAGLLVALVLLRAVGTWARDRRRRLGRRRRGLRDLLPFGAVVAIVAGLTLWLSGAHQLVWTLAIVAGLVLADIAAGIVLGATLRGDGSGEPASIAAAYEPVLRRLARFILAVAAFVSVLAVWNINVLMQAATDGPLARFIGQAINVAVVVLLCDLAWIAIKTFIARQLLASPAHEGEAASRLSTLLPMVRTTVMIVLGGLVTLVVLSAMGVNIAPLLAGAGVVGLAIGFGAQTLVRDVITGVFFLIEDAFRVGEYIDVGARKGTVEAISLRSFRLRHQRGALHTVPFGEIKSLSNESRDWSIVKLEFRIPFDTDLGKVKKIVKAINMEIAADPELGPNLIEPIKSQGINRFEEYWMVLRVKYTAKPNSFQFMIRREAYQRIRDAFEAAGIKLGERSVRVEVAGQDRAGHAAAGAAADDDGTPIRPAPV